jgi:nicotinamidase-related amidase
VLPVLNALAPARIVLYGVALDVCDRYAVEGLLKHRHDIRLSLVTDAVRAIHDDQSAALLRGWEQRGVQLVTSAQVLAA